MNDRHAIDEQIAEYVRATVRSEPPPDLVPSILDAVDAAPSQRAWYASPVPAFAGTAVLVLAIGAALLLWRPWMVADPSPTPSLLPSASPSLAATPTTQPSPSATLGADGLLETGDSIELAAVDPQGEWGTIRIERGEDLGGYADAEIGPDAFIIEFFVEYSADRLPDPERFGASDWSLRPTDPDAESFFVVEPVTFERFPSGVRPDRSLGNYPGAIDIFTTPTKGWIAFQVQRRAADLELELVYQPAGLEDPAATVVIREPGERPEPVEPDDTPQPPEGPEYVERPGLPFTVLESPEADELFSRLDTCTNVQDGYSLTFPDDWYTNTETGDVPACSWFTPQFFEVAQPGEARDDIWITMSVIDGAVGYIGTTEVYSDERVTIDGLQARRVEFNPNPNGQPDYRSYHYVIQIDAAIEGPTFVAATDTNAAADYALARAVLDRLMAALEFDR